MSSSYSKTREIMLFSEEANNMIQYQPRILSLIPSDNITVIDFSNKGYQREVLNTRELDNNSVSQGLRPYTGQETRMQKTHFSMKELQIALQSYHISHQISYHDELSNEQISQDLSEIFRLLYVAWDNEAFNTLLPFVAQLNPLVPNSLDNLYALMSSSYSDFIKNHQYIDSATAFIVPTHETYYDLFLRPYGLDKKPFSSALTFPIMTMNLPLNSQLGLNDNEYGYFIVDVNAMRGRMGGAPQVIASEDRPVKAFTEMRITYESAFIYPKNLTNDGKYIQFIPIDPTSLPTETQLTTSS